MHVRLYDTVLTKSCPNAHTVEPNICKLPPLSRLCSDSDPMWNYCLLKIPIYKLTHCLEFSSNVNVATCTRVEYDINSRTPGIFSYRCHILGCKNANTHSTCIGLLLKLCTCVRVNFCSHCPWNLAALKLLLHQMGFWKKILPWQDFEEIRYLTFVCSWTVIQ